MKVSIIVPVYNASKYLRKCLDSLFQQSYSNIEVICINDGSTDNSLDILNEYKEKYENQLYIKTVENGGQANARNLGIELASGDFVMFVDSDDCIDLNTVERMMDKQKESQADIVVCEIDRIFEGKFSSFTKKFQYDTSLPFTGTTTVQEHPEIIPFLTAAVYAKLIRKSFIDEHHISFIKGYIYEDFVFTQNMLSCQPVLYIMHDQFYKYYVRQNTTMTSKKSRVTDMFHDIDVVYSYYKKENLVDTYKTELDFLCYYHVMVGTSFRMWNSKQYGLFHSLKECRKFVRKYHCQKKNKYLKEKGFVFEIFVKIFG